MLITADREAHDYVSACVKIAKGEIGGIGYVQLVDKGHFHITEFVLLEQEASSAHVDFDGDAYVEEITRAAEANRENELRLSWHSHGHMDVYWSNTDEDGIKEYKSLGMPWLVSLVFNKDGDYEARLDIFDHDTCDQIKMQELDYEVEPVDETVTEKAKADVEKLVKSKALVQYGSGYKSAKNSSKGKNTSPSGYKWTPKDEDEDEDDKGDLEPLPDWLDLDDFMHPDSYAILEMQYGTKQVEAWEDEMFDQNGMSVIESVVVGNDDEVRILTP